MQNKSTRFFQDRIFPPTTTGKLFQCFKLFFFLSISSPEFQDIHSREAHKKSFPQWAYGIDFSFHYWEAAGTSIPLLGRDFVPAFRFVDVNDDGGWRRGRKSASRHSVSFMLFMVAKLRERYFLFRNVKGKHCIS